MRQIAAIACNKAIFFAKNTCAIAMSCVPLCLTLLPASLSAQWTSGSGDIYYNGGNVGIGTSSPSQLLTVNGAATVEGQSILADVFRVYSGSSDGNSSYSDLRVNAASGNAVLSASSGALFFNYDHGANGTFWANGGGQSYAYMSQTGQLTLNHNAVLGTVTIPSLRNTLDAYGGVAIGSYANTNAAPVNGLIVSGNTGIGNASPRTNLDVNGQIVAVNRLTLAQDTGTTTTTWHVDNSTGLFRLFWQPNINTGGTVVMTATTSGNVGIATADPQYPLSVNGVIQAKEVIVNTGWSDYVFEPNYKVQPLTEVAAFIKANHHLPGIPSQAEVAAKGVSVGEMESKLLAKVEELTMHMIQLEQENRTLAQKVAQLEKH